VVDTVEVEDQHQEVEQWLVVEEQDQCQKECLVVAQPGVEEEDHIHMAILTHTEDMEVYLVVTATVVTAIIGVKLEYFVIPTAIQLNVWQLVMGHFVKIIQIFQM
tara:strand:- start:209 stop:523 length:315 start_codon:yes stop_codon:yes gene_type:complete